jgi:hypothetical protein
VGAYTEVVRVVVARHRRYNPDKRKVDVLENVPLEMTSAPVCCVSDIPATHLGYHAYRYGKFALGFHRSPVVRHGFNPVFYTLEDTEVVRSIHEGFSELQFANLDDVRDAATSAENAIDDLPDDVDADDVRSYLSAVESEADTVEGYVDNAQDSLKKFLAFVKTFKPRSLSIGMRRSVLAFSE